jgi:aquaporin Z
MLAEDSSLKSKDLEITEIAFWRNLGGRFSVKPRGSLQKEPELVINKYLGEFFGTFILVGLGSMAILSVGGATGAAEIVAIGLGFGLALLAGVWAVGHLTGAHFNPAVTLAALIDKRIGFGDAVGYWVAQFAGATVGSLLILALSDTATVAGTQTTYTDLTTAIFTEVTLTAVFVWVILAVTSRGENHAPLAIALTLVGAHIAGIPFSGASLNPARSFGPAVVSGEIGTSLGVYIYAPLIGAVIAWGLYRLFSVEQTDAPANDMPPAESAPPAV